MLRGSGRFAGGTLTSTLLIADGSAATPSFAFANRTDVGFWLEAASTVEMCFGRSGVFGGRLNSGGIVLRNIASLSFTATDDQTAAPEVSIFRDAANTIAQRNGTAAQSSRLYNTFTDASNYERLETLWASNILSLRTAAAGTGTARALRLGAGGTDRWDLGATSGNLVGITATSGLGYGTGAGGTVTQLTNKSTGVTLNTITGIVTMNGASLAADTTVSFVLTNSAIAATDAVIVLHESVGTLGAYSFASTAAAGSVTIAVHNNTPGALAEAIVLRFVVIKSVNS